MLVALPRGPTAIGQRKCFAAATRVRFREAEYPEVVAADRSDGDARLPNLGTMLFATDKNFQSETMFARRNFDLFHHFMIAGLQRPNIRRNITADGFIGIVAIGLVRQEGRFDDELVIDKQASRVA